MLTFKKDGARIVREHFAEITDEQFNIGLHQSCPELFQTMPTDFGDHEKIIPNDFDPAEAVKPVSTWKRIRYLLLGR